MSITRTLAFTLAATLLTAPVSSVVSAAQQNGMLGGKATDKAEKPYDHYNVRARVAQTAAVAESVPLDAQGKFSIASLPLGQSYLIELFDTKNNKVVCTEGPFGLSTTVTSKTDINIDCGRKHPTSWLLAAGAGAALIAAATQSSSQ